MKVKILNIRQNKTIDAEIIRAINITLPSLADDWRFNFKKHSKKKGFETYVIVSKDTPGIIEGCLIFQVKEEVEPYMAFIELAPISEVKIKYSIKLKAA